MELQRKIHEEILAFSDKLENTFGQIITPSPIISSKQPASNVSDKGTPIKIKEIKQKVINVIFLDYLN